LENLPTFLKLTVRDHLRRFNSGLRGGGRSLDITTDVREDDLNCYLGFRTREERASLVIPKPRKDEFGNVVVGDRNIRAVCPFMVVINGQPQHVTYEGLVSVLVSCNIEELFPEQGKRNFLDKILFGFGRNRGRLAVNLCQRFLNRNLFNALPLSGTPMQDWAMNHRLMIFDSVFNKLRPDEKLEYQRRKNELLFPWSSIGLSDGAAAVKNYILQADLREYTAFGVRHHNPMRNLYPTLGMKGEETACVVSKSALKLEKRGVERKGWNWMTVFLDLPDTFEDQILVDKRHAGKEVSYRRSVTIHGEETVLEGDNILKGRILGVNEDESPVIFDIDCDHAKVLECKDGVVPFDGKEQPVRIVVLEVVYSLKEGFKLTNQHGNKGIIRLMDLGMMWQGDIPCPIDVIVSANSVQRRKNFGQVLEALANMVNPYAPHMWAACKESTGRTVVPDDCEVTLEQVQEALKRNGLPEDGTSKVKTPWGEFRTLAGVVHWGVTKTPEEQLWEGCDTWVENQRGLRTRGNKVSTIELKALTTLCGPGSRVVEEILSHQQGVEEVRELLQILRGIRGQYQESLPTVDPDAFVYVPAGMGTFHEEQRLIGTIADEELYPRGCYLKLPFPLYVRVPLERWKSQITEGIAGRDAYAGADGDSRTMEFDRILIPAADLRRTWRHPTGMFGLSEIATLLNQILEAIDRLKFGEIKEEQVSTLVFRYLHAISRDLSLKTGKVSTYLMAVRYPWSSKATAVLGQDLEPNWVEIHKDMARDLKVKTGDYVLVERFPCLGFMSTRIQRVRVTSDPACKYVIRASGNSLVSMNLDFDGDVVYIMSFHTDGAKEELRRNFHEPHPRIKEVLDRLNNRKQQLTRPMNLQELGLQSFGDLTPKEHADLNATSLAVKIWTGPVIALCYNLMRIVEGNIPYHDREGHINVEVFLDKVGNSVFSQKHGVRSLREECIEAVCLADSEALIKLGFPSRETHQLCQIIRRCAAKLGLRSDAELQAHYRRHLEEGRSNVINTIVRRFHKSYFATRAELHPVDLLEHLETRPRDLVGHLIQRSLGADETCQRLEAGM
jgi:hypothetical protein